MMMNQKYGRIVVGVDGSDGSKAALRWAVGQAELSGAKVEAVAAWEYPATYGWAPMYSDDETLPELTKKQVSETVRDTLGAEAADLVGVTVTEGQSAHVLLTSAAGADLLVVGRRGRGGFAGLLLGSVSQHCVHHASCPVVVVPRAE
ncbi:MAG: universal stress protein [Mycobacteriaceae bacterium]|jgi:nucleotide-binding universal stress UspA family protein